MSAPPSAGTRAVFTQGSVFRHVAVMTGTSSIGLMAIFLIDVMSMFYVSMGHRDDWRAAVSLMSKVMFFPFALNMGMMIGIGTVVSIAIGRGDRDGARRAATMGLVLTAGLGLAVSLGALPFRTEILRSFGADGETLEETRRLLGLVLPVNALLSVGMGCASILRAAGDPTRAMLVTLAGGIVISISDPLFIFGFGQGVDGVGTAIIAARVIFAFTGLWFVAGVHRLLALPRLSHGAAGLMADTMPIALIAIPAMGANLALPFADWYVARIIWQYGVGASAAAGVYDRIMPFAFSIVFALTSSIGPIAGQNLGAGAYRRVRQTFLWALAFAGGYSIMVWLIVFMAAPVLETAFGLSGTTGDFFLFLCRYATLAWVFVGLLLVANAMFNTLGRAHVATLFNWGRATLGTIPFVWLGAYAAGPELAMMGIVVAALMFAAAALLLANAYTQKLVQEAQSPPPQSWLLTLRDRINLQWSRSVGKGV